jgi:dihydropteroate synthase
MWSSFDMSDVARVWKVGHGRVLALDVPRVMGIVNDTPDSFSDGGECSTVEAAIDRALRMGAEGADVLDVGGESTRPGAARVDEHEQVRRVVPVVRALRRLNQAVVISVDTTLAGVAEEAINAGADAINDVSAGMEDERMLALVASRKIGIVLMHRLRPPDLDVFSHRYQKAPEYPGGVVEDVKRFLAERAAAAIREGVQASAIVLDPGLGFGKSVAQNLELIERTGEIAAMGYPVLSGLSRKSFTAAYAGMSMDAPARERLGPTLALSARHMRAGAGIFRVHDVQQHVRMLRSAGDAA